MLQAEFKVYDGYMKACKTFLDMDGDGVLSLGDPHGDTNQYGVVSLSAAQTEKNDEVVISLTDGTDGDCFDAFTGSALPFQLSAPRRPAGGYVTPLTTMQVELMQAEGISSTQAGERVKALFSLDDVDDINDFNVIHNLYKDELRAKAAGRAVTAAIASLVQTANLVVAHFSTADSNSTNTVNTPNQISKAFFAAIAAGAGQQGRVQLDSVVFVKEHVMGSVRSALGASENPEAEEAIADAVVLLTQIVEDYVKDSSSTSGDFLTGVSATTKTSGTQMASAIENFAKGTLEGGSAALIRDLGSASVQEGITQNLVGVDVEIDPSDGTGETPELPDTDEKGNLEEQAKEILEKGKSFIEDNMYIISIVGGAIFLLVGVAFVHKKHINRMRARSASHGMSSPPRDIEMNQRPGRSSWGDQ
jgi:hypothetical protein